MGNIQIQKLHRRIFIDHETKFMILMGNPHAKNSATAPQVSVVYTV